MKDIFPHPHIVSGICSGVKDAFLEMRTTVCLKTKQNKKERRPFEIQDRYAYHFAKYFTSLKIYM